MSRQHLVTRAVASRPWAALREHLPFRVAFGVEGVALASDLPTLRRLMGYRSWDASRGLVTLRVRALEGQPVQVRPDTSDLWAVTAMLPPWCHLPPEDLDLARAARIWDLGANIGVTMAHMAVRAPSARIAGVELDAGNATLARRNVAPWADRCDVLQAAVWVHDGTVAYDGVRGEEVGFHVQDGGWPVPALSLNRLLEREDDPDAVIDYVKMDIEGAEREVLRANTEWAAHVRTMKVEVHDPYTVPECVADLEALGFDATPERLTGWSDGKVPVVARRR
jgi:FkbM family methyltransferase